MSKYCVPPLPDNSVWVDEDAVGLGNGAVWVDEDAVGLGGGGGVGGRGRWNWSRRLETRNAEIHPVSDGVQLFGLMCHHVLVVSIGQLHHIIEVPAVGYTQISLRKRFRHNTLGRTHLPESRSSLKRGHPFNS